ncbi:MAG: class I SAM-dependent methyltransferase [Phycisphaeraceae bacterium]
MKMTNVNVEHRSAGAAARAVLAEVCEAGTVEQPDGAKVRVTANISQPNVQALQRVIADRQPRTVVEIGMAHGVSTVTILQSLAEVPGGRLISIDPYIGWPTGREIALHQVQRAGLSDRHEHLHMFSHLGLPRLIEQGVQPDLIYIDGSHAFADVFVDFFFSDQLLKPGGVVAFNDAAWPDVFRVIRQVRKRADYRELDVGLPRVYRSRNPLYTLVKRLAGMSVYDRYFEKQ